jgi:hypothetical protein
VLLELGLDLLGAVGLLGACLHGSLLRGLR